jgi:cyclic pyranopterin phosphate synthase
MDVGSTNGWEMNEVLPSKAVISMIHAQLPLTPLGHTAKGETAKRWGYTDAFGQHDPKAGEIGVISSVTEAFCGDCNRARLSTEGQLFLCLFANRGHDLRTRLRNGQTDQDLTQAIQTIWQGRSDNYSEQRTDGSAQKIIPIKRVEMSYIGG